MMRGELMLIDTNVLLNATIRSRPDHLTCIEIIRSAPSAGIHLVTVAQVFREYLVVATRPRENNGLGLSSLDAIHNIRSFRSRVHIIPETSEVLAKLIELVELYNLVGKRIHDANLIASMNAHRVPTLVTVNVSDFAVFAGISVYDPNRALAELSGTTDP